MLDVIIRIWDSKNKNVVYTTDGDFSDSFDRNDIILGVQGLCEEYNLDGLYNICVLVCKEGNLLYDLTDTVHCISDGSNKTISLGRYLDNFKTTYSIPILESIGRSLDTDWKLITGEIADMPKKEALTRVLGQRGIVVGSIDYLLETIDSIYNTKLKDK